VFNYARFYSIVLYSLGFCSLFLFPTVTVFVCACWGLVVCVKKVFLIDVKLHPKARESVNTIIACFKTEGLFKFGAEAEKCDNLDSDLIPGAENTEVKRVRPNRKLSYASRVAQSVKAQVGLLKYSKANEMVYARLVRTEMKSHGVRPAHIAHLAPIAVAACFIPLDSDILAASMRQTAEFQELQAQMGPDSSK